MAKRIIIAGGGTGGHIFPAIAIANALRKLDPQTELLFVGANGKMEMEKVPQAGYSIKGIDIAGFNRSSLIKNIGLPLKLFRSFFQVREIFRSFRPDACIGVGGYSSFPVLRYAQSRGIPSFIHESNSFAGKSNKLLGRKATAIFTAGDGMEAFFPKDRIVITGNPVRQAILDNPYQRAEALRAFGLEADKKTILVTGGSLGARGINEAIADGLMKLAEHPVQLIWQTGKPFAEKAKALCAGQSWIWTDAFINRMEEAYAAADLVVSRSGAMTIAELCVAKKAVIFVPFPFAAEDHQTVNARHLVEKGAARMVSDAGAKAQLLPELLNLLNHEDDRKQLQQAIGQLAIRDADTRIAREVLNRINQS